MVNTAELIELRDEALAASSSIGKRYKLGKFSAGHAVALWHSSEDGFTKLRDHGARIGEYSLWARWPTSLEISMTHEASRALEITAFDMDLDSGLVEVHRKAITAERPNRDLLNAEIAKRHDRKLGLHAPTNDDWDLLYEELRRGASGAYAVGNINETS